MIDEDRQRRQYSARSNHYAVTEDPIGRADVTYLSDIALNCEIGAAAYLALTVESDHELRERFLAIEHRCGLARRRFHVVKGNGRAEATRAPSPRPPLKMIPAESPGPAPALIQEDELTTRYVAYLERELRRAPGTVKAQLKSLQRVERVTGVSIVDVIMSVDKLREFKRRAVEIYTVSTVIQTLSAVHGVHDFGVLEGLWPPQPSRAVKGPRSGPRALKPPLRPREALRFLEAAEKPSELRVAWLGLYAGTGINESALMSPEMFDGDRLRYTRQKTGVVIEVPVHHHLAPRLEEILATRPSSPRALEYAVESLKRKTGLRTAGAPPIAISSHIFRRTFTTQLLDVGVPLWMVELLVGHQSSSMTLTAYASVPFWRKAEALSRLDYSKPGQVRLW